MSKHYQPGWGYREAAGLDKRIDRLLRDQPPTQDNTDEWTAFTRTVKTSLNLIELKVLKILDRGCRRRWDDEV